jgi:5-methylcytosine-specific restriction protein B
LRTRPEPTGGDGVDVDTDGIAALAAELYLPAATVEEWLALLREKRQIIFYGPPGTGKTYVARKLAALIAGDPARQRLVQFHPSTSYEDFFEGYRPETTAEGNLGYRLVPGPLALLAAQAEVSSGVEHVMVIDEINRANLPKVFGELLFLLEYRDEQVQTLYRSEDAFELPKNLLFIGTMNTADKSIALIDAALRRRFHFVPFFPHEEPHNAVLASWLEDNNSEAGWVAGLIEHVNARLIELLGGPHVQIGPSHFFSKDLDEDMVRRIWRYSVLPFIEDQIWGQADLLQTFEFDQVLAAYRAAGGGTPEDLPVATPAHGEPSEVHGEAPQEQ